MKRVKDSSVEQFQRDVEQRRDLLASVDAKTPPSILFYDASLIGFGQNYVLYHDGPGSTDTRYDVVPAALRTEAREAVVWQRIRIGDTPYLVLGTSVQPAGVEVYEFVSLANQEEDLSRLARNSAYAAAIAIAISMLMGLFAARGVLLPLRRLGLAARRLGAGKLDTRLEVRGSDEVADVSRTFNDTAEALERSVAELRSLEASSRRFVADVSHELRTPLTAMTAVTDMLEEATDVGDESAPAAQLIVNETRRLARLVEDLMEVSRFDAGTAELRREDVDLVDLVRNCLDARAWLGKVTMDVPASMPVRVDQRRIDVIVANMVGNALKHGGDGRSSSRYPSGAPT